MKGGGRERGRGGSGGDKAIESRSAMNSASKLTAVNAPVGAQGSCRGFAWRVDVFLEYAPTRKIASSGFWGGVISRGGKIGDDS